MASRRRAPRPRAVKAPSPLSRLRLAAHLTIPELAERFGVTVPTVSRWLSGDRPAPHLFITALHAAAIGDVEAVARAQAAYVEERQRRHPKVIIEVVLPPGTDPEEARLLCVRALAGARRGAP